MARERDLRRGRARPGDRGVVQEVLITLRQSKRTFVNHLDFVTSAGHLDGNDSRVNLRFPGKGPVAVITDLGILTPHPVSRELTLTSVHSGVTVDAAVAATGWPLEVVVVVEETAPPTDDELTVLRDPQARTARAHAGQA